ncbi:SMP-30/gluconolactonase/LRE family protein [Streptomyces sp. HC44]|uniref:SMP-30/gluconolactonase/LRE family protein n=1 Tax=Streptomyces scabichelini TaxID=2711217 RepID=A0A6G4V5G2_9ACTN|nr:SMP-30/gluconolactonase/LRE family protein [Streptomyces scabichelini]NGO09083.1 SMP-30/gluconolactonase/LRE family protein [Streptomyces scabichelini]
MASAAHQETAIAVHGDYELAEGGRWVGDRYVYVDILSGRLFELRDGTTGHAPRQLARLDVPLGAVAPVHGRPGTWIAAAGTGIALLGPDGDLEWLDRPEDRTPVPTRMNDGVADRAGRFWAGSMPYDGTPGAGSLYRTDTDGTVVRVLDGLTVVNGPAFTADGTTMYLADSAAGTVLRCHVDPATGDLTGPETFVRFHGGEGSPDGMTVDDEGCLWVAVWGGSSVRRYHPDGRLLMALALPATQPTSVCLHPSDSRILITTARYGMTNPTASAGAVLTAPVPARAPAAAAAVISTA